MKKNNAGFTLIELLVVVLIIGILSSIALPQYQKATEKSRAVQPLVLLKSLGQSQEAHYMANGGYADKFEKLDMEMPWNEAEKWCTDGEVSDTRSNGDWSLQIYKSPIYEVLFMGRLRGAYKGGGWVYVLKHPSLSAGLYCTERKGSGLRFNRPDGDYCRRVFGSSGKIWSNATINYYAF